MRLQYQRLTWHPPLEPGTCKTVCSVAKNSFVTLRTIRNSEGQYHWACLTADHTEISGEAFDTQEIAEGAAERYYEVILQDEVFPRQPQGEQ